MITRRPTIPRYRPLQRQRLPRGSWSGIRPAMQFRVGPWTYNVHWSIGQLISGSDQPVDGLCCWSDFEIWLNSVIDDPAKVGEVLAHELSHAWDEAFGVSSDAEGRSNRAASFTWDFMKQLAEQGGISALMLRRMPVTSRML